MKFVKLFLEALITVLPPHSAFYSSLKNSNISEEEYEFVKKA